MSNYFKKYPDAEGFYEGYGGAFIPPALEVEMKKITELCKVLFDIDLGNIYKTFDEIKTRKKDPTKFIDLIKTSLLKKLNAAE